MAGTEDAWTAVSVGLVIVVAIVDGAVGGGLETVLVAGPLVASTQLSPRRTAAVAALALGSALGLAGYEGHLGVLHVTLRLIALGLLGGICVAAAHTIQRHKQRFERLAVVAEAAQLAILRPIPARVGNVSFAVRYLSAAEDALIGGDLYDVVTTPNSVRLLVGDVRGKGIEAIRLAALVLGFFREAAALEDDLAAIAKVVDSAVTGYLGDEDFVTAVFVEFGPAGQVTIVNCGHHPPLRIGTDQVDLLAGADPNPPLGLSPQFVVDRHTLQPGQRLLMYTDGLVEARGPDGAFFTLERIPARLLAVGPLDGALDALVDRLLAHVGGRLSDDLALVLAEPTN